jgi:hypothetical protein
LTGLEILAERFERFGTVECRHSSPLYARLALGVAADAEMLELAAQAPAGQPVPNVLFAAVHYLLLRGEQDPLAAYYPSMGGGAAPEEDVYLAFRAFCLAHRGAITELLRTRLVQTNEVRRCACLLPAFGLVADLAGGRPLALVEVGASAGVNLLWDRYGYENGGSGRCGDPGSPVQLACAVRGHRRPPILTAPPRVASRLGLDLHQVDMGNPEEVLWLRALIWPEHVERMALLEQAIAVARRDPPALLAEDALERLPGALAAIPPEVAICVFHSFTANQLSAAARDRLAKHGAGQPVYRVWMEGAAGGDAELGLAVYTGGSPAERVLAICEPHGRWIVWQGAATT